MGLDEDALFLSTHVSLPVEQRKPSAEVVDETVVLETLREAIDTNESRNLVVAVTGPSGSGKSHLVRWLRANLDLSDPRIEVVYVPRRVTSLREITQLLLAQLGGSLADELQEQVDQAVESIGEFALAETLLNRLWELLKFRPPPGAVPYADQLLPLMDGADQKAGRGGLAFLLGKGRVRDHLLRPTGVLAMLARSVLGERTGGDTEKPSFTPSELDFGRLSGVRASLPRHAVTALNILGREGGRAAAATLLNAVRDTAIQEVLGMRQGRGLREVFADARKRLHGRQLVVMFEDLALMDFVEGAVLDEFANHGDANHAPLRVVFAVTDDKYATLEETIEGRVTHRYWIGEIPLHNLSTTSERKRRNEFFARYLNAARVGRDALLSARQSGKAIPNQCNECEFRTECLDAFGQVDTDIGPIGLYPYNDSAIAHGITKQFDDRHRENRVLTPRWVIERLIDFVLVQAHGDLKKESMPSDRVTNELKDGSVLRSPRDLVPEFDEGTEDLTRVFNVRGYWFDCGRETSGVARAFALPRGAEHAEPEPEPPVDDDSTTVVPKRELPDPIAAILAWEQGTRDTKESKRTRDTELDPRASTELRRLLREFTEQRVDLDRYLIHSTSPIVKELLKAALGDASFEIYGAPGAARTNQLSIPIPRSNASSRLLIAAIWLRDHSHWVFDDPSRKWDLPGTRDPAELAVEFETFLADCAYKVEASVVSTLFASGEDPVQVAVDLKALATMAVSTRDGLVPPSWRAVANEAWLVLDSSVSDDMVTAFAAARQSPAAGPAAIDTSRTRVLDVDQMGGLVEELREHFPILTQRWNALRTAIDAAIKPTLEELLVAINDLSDMLGEDDPRAVGEAAIVAGRMANNERLLSETGGVVDFENAAQRVREFALDRSKWESFKKAGQSSDPTPGRILHAIPFADSLLQIVNDLRLIQSALTTTRELLDHRLSEQTGGRSIDSERRNLVSARDDLIGAIAAASRLSGET
jgi:Cdc6-like AAA superfamily ATPase